MYGVISSRSARLRRWNTMLAPVYARGQSKTMVIASRHSRETEQIALVAEQGQVALVGFRPKSEE
jgi:hypothetical protein